MRPIALSAVQVAGRKLLAGGSSQNPAPSYTDLFLQSYESCEGPLAYAHLDCISSQSSGLHTRHIRFTALHPGHFVYTG